jgi:SAM-dependent methyltransferase
MSVLIKSSKVSREEAESLVNSVSWFHRVEILPGLVAPGHIPFTGAYDAQGFIDSLRLGMDLTGQRVLEIGTWDGPLAYELKQRGANVVATDIQDPDKTGFNVIGKIAGLDVPYVRASVYDLHKHFKDEFDVVLFLGVYYHLKYPVLAFEAIARTLKMGGQLYVEGAALGSHFQNIAGQTVAQEEQWRIGRALAELDKLGIPLTLAYPGTYMQGCNWFLPNMSTMRGWLKNAGFEEESMSLMDGGTEGEKRIIAKAVKVRDAAYLEHNLTGEEGGVSLI